MPIFSEFDIRFSLPALAAEVALLHWQRGTRIDGYTGRT